MCCLGSERLDPRPHLDLKRPSAARLAQDIEVGLGNRLGIERTVRPVVRVRVPGAANTAVDHEMRDMDPLWPQFSRRALRQATKRELAHGERRGVRVALYTRAGAGQQDCAGTARDHSPCRLLDDQKAAEGRYLD